MKDRQQKGIHTYLILKLLLAFVTLLAMQVAFLAANTRIFHIDGFAEWIGVIWGNFVFGAATMALFFAPFSLLLLLPLQARWKRGYRIMTEVLYLLPMLLIVVPRGANMAYYQYTYRLLSDEIFSYLGISGQMGSLLPHFATDYWYAWAVPLTIFALFLYFNSRVRLAPIKYYRRNIPYEAVVFIAGITFFWLGARGGFGHFIRPTDAAHYCQPKNTALVSNDAYNILRSLFSPDLKEADYLDPREAAALFPATHIPTLKAAAPDIAADSLPTQPRNVVLLIVESLGQEFMGCYNHQRGADTRTPFLDSLALHSTYYDGRSNGKKSIEGITAITTSIPNLMSVPLTNSAYRADEMTGIPTILKRHGYRCAFFHGSYNGVMDFDITCRRLGFDEYHGKDEYEADPSSRPDDYDGVWGIYDEPFLQYTLRQLSSYNEPFFAEVFTVTSHHPFPIPAAYKDRFAEGRHPILKCVEYTDYALRLFFDEASRQSWFENTLFIVCGDHSGHGLTREYNDYDGWYRIPMIVFDPQDSLASGYNPRIVQQTDIFPSLIDYLGYNDRFVSFGESVYRSPAIGRQLYYGNGYYVMVANNPSNPRRHDITLLMGDTESGTLPDKQHLKAAIQRYNNIVINNKLILP